MTCNSDTVDMCIKSETHVGSGYSWVGYADSAGCSEFGGVEVTVVVLEDAAAEDDSTSDWVVTEPGIDRDGRGVFWRRV